MKLHIRYTAAVMALLMTATMAFSGCGKDGGSANAGGGILSELKANPIEGEDVFGGEVFDEMVWGYYEADCYEYTGSNDDATVFLTDMEYITVDDNGSPREFAALPLSVQFGSFSHFTDSFFYGDEYYELYTEEGRAMYRKAYIEEVGDMTEEQFMQLENSLHMDVAELTLALPDGATYMYTAAYTIDGHTLSLYPIDVIDDFSVSVREEPIVTYDFLHTGGKLSLKCKNVQRDYLAGGYKTTDSSLSCSGYALNDENRYHDLDGFSFYRYGVDEEITAYVTLSNGADPIDPVMTLDQATGNFSLSWQQCWETVNGRIEKVDDPRTISGTIVPCTSYGFTNYEGMLLLIDGTCYRYLMSQDEYDERLYSGVLSSGADDYSSSDLETISAAKNSILEELKKALDAAGIEAAIDTVTGKVALEANFLFANDSAEISAEGKDYLNRFTDVYTAVVLEGTYSDYIASIVVEGHTDTSGSYSYNQTLSENRANAVAAQCTARNSELSPLIQTQGFSYDYPVYNNDGSVNMEKSRRVTFRFVFTDFNA